MTRKQIRFCEEYLIDWNATRAALEAGYSKKTAYSIGHENLKKPEIQAYLKEIQQDLSKLAGVSALRNIQELKKTAYSSIADFHGTWIDLKDFESLDDNQKACIESIETRIDRRTIKEDDAPIDIEVKQVKLKLHSKHQAIEIMNKMLGYNSPEKTENKNINYNSEPLTKEKIKQISKDIDDEYL